MVIFWLCYDLNKHTSGQNSILGLHPASWAVAAIGPLVQGNICDIVTSTWTCHQLGHLGSWSDCQAIDTTYQTPLWTSSIMHRVHFFFFTPPPALILRCFFNPILYHIDDMFDTHWRVHHMCQLLRGCHISVYFFLKSWIVYMPSAWCTVHETTPLNGCAEVEEMPITAMVWCLQGYKFTLHLMLISISHSSLLLALGLFPSLSSANHQWRTREASSEHTLSP
jgi:hypothetical protein